MVILATYEMAGLRVSDSHLTTESATSVTVVTSWLARQQDTVVKMASGKGMHQHATVSHCHAVGLPLY